MKTLKLAMVAVIIAFAMVSVANTDNGSKIVAKKVVHITFEKAVQNPALRLAMHQQLNPSFLKVDKPFYTVSVSLGSTVYRITGSRSQWVSFLKPIIIGLEVGPLSTPPHN